MKQAMIIAAILIVAGLIICAVSIFHTGFNFKKLSSQKYISSSKNITESFQNILIKTNTSDITFKLSDSGECKIESNLPEKFEISAVVEDGTLNIRVKDTRKWYEHLKIDFFSFENDVVTVYLPQGECGNLEITTNTGDISAPSNLKFANVNVKVNTADVSIYSDVSGDMQIITDTGDVKFSNIQNMQNLTLKTNTGDIAAEQVNAQGVIDINVDTGDVKLNNFNGKALKIKSDTGEVFLKNVIILDTVDIKTDTGDVDLSSFDGANIKIRTDTGDVRGSLLTPKYFVVKSDTGREIYPSDSYSEERCEITTDTGDIKITIE